MHLNIRECSFGLAQVRVSLISENCYAFVIESLYVTQVLPIMTEIVLCERKFFDPGETLRDTLI